MKIILCCFLIFVARNPFPATAFVSSAKIRRGQLLPPTTKNIDASLMLPPTVTSRSSVMLSLKTSEEESTSTATAPKIGPSVFFLGFAAMLAKLVFTIQDSSLPITVGTSTLLFVSAAVAYDNLVIGLGDILFPNARTNELQYTTLKWLSYPRFIFHASGVPFLFTTVAEIGKYAGIEWLESNWIQQGIVGAAIVIALASRLEFFQSPGIELKDTSDSPPNALERQLLWFTYKKPNILYVLPSILLALWSLVIGVEAFQLDGDAHAAGVLLITSAVGVLAGNAQASFVARFTGNFAEVIMLWCLFVAAAYVMY